ncbi:hypothetical protein ABFS83_05G022300 [Erythranthe nasuta]
MLREEEKDQAVGWKTYSRSVSWTERPPRKSNSNPQWNSKARACLPPLQPLSITRPSIEEWPKAGSDDLGVWPNPPTPGARPRSLTPRENSTGEQHHPREFEFRRDKIAFFDMECSRVLDHIYLGSDAIAKNREILRQNGITHVLNCVGFVCPEYFKNELVYKTLWLQDCPSQDITSILYDVFDYFEDVREQGGRVLVHCCHGVSRSTSLVIAYLMWKEGRSFDDAFQHVKTARGVANPNVGFACQLLQCQKRVHALPASPSSVIRMYRVAPHSPYDPLHLVPKMLSEPGADKLDSRGAFIVHIPSAIYVWIGTCCSSVMSENAKAAASQVVRYESAQCPVVTVEEGEETSEFWDAFSYIKGSDNGCHVKSKEEKSFCAGSKSQRKLDEYDLDFEIFHKALAFGVVPPFPLSEAGSETCLPARENGWNRLRRKFVKGIVKELNLKKVEDTVPLDNVSLQSSTQCDSPDSFASYVTSSSSSKKTDLKSPSFDLVDSFSTFFVSKPKSDLTSPSVSPSTSDYSSSFTFSPSSSNWSDSSFVSAQSSPQSLELGDSDSAKSGPLEESAVPIEDEKTRLSEEAITILPSIDEESRTSSQNSSMYLEDDEHDSDANGHEADADVLSRLCDEKNDGKIDRTADDTTNKIAGEKNVVFYEWPSMLKMDMNSGILDSRSVYIIVIPEVSFGTKKVDALYVWIGRNVSLEGSDRQLIKNDNSKHEDIRARLEALGLHLLVEKGFSKDARIKIVEEGEEPEQLVEYLACLSIGKDSDKGGGI